MIKKALVGIALASLVNHACGGPPGDDPFIGMWTRPASTAVCQFAPNGDWTNGCGLGTGGWPSAWTRIVEGEYYLGIGNGVGCDAKGVFSNRNDAVTLTLRCGSTDSTVVSLTRFRP